MPTSATSAVDKALDLIETVADSDRPLRLTEIADRLGMHRATAYRVLLDLVRRGWVLRLGDHYLPGTAILRLSHAAAANSLAGVARPVLETLAAETGMMVNLQVPTEDRSRVIDVVRPPRLAMISDLRDELLPVHRFAGPLALVAALDEEARAPTCGPPRRTGIRSPVPTVCSPTSTAPRAAGSPSNAVEPSSWSPRSAGLSPRRGARRRSARSPWSAWSRSSTTAGSPRWRSA